jgi:hypothetical protein
VSRLPKLGDVEFVLRRRRRGARSAVSELGVTVVERRTGFGENFAS